MAGESAEIPAKQSETNKVETPPEIIEDSTNQRTASLERSRDNLLKKVARALTEPIAQGLLENSTIVPLKRRTKADPPREQDSDVQTTTTKIEEDEEEKKKKRKVPL